jgi:hypothetical protein
MQFPDPRTWFRPPEQLLLIDAGRVGCPFRGDADVECCFACGHMIQISGGRQPRVVCDYRPERQLTTFVRRFG